VVEQMNGRWQVKQPHLRPLVSEAAELSRQLGEVRYTWVPRARNAHADRLANEAMDAQAGITQRAGAQTAPPSHWTAARLANTNGVAAVVSSPLRRARQTAQPVADALGVPLTVHDGLTETDFGAWDGLTFAKARERDPDLHTRWLADTSLAPPGGESMDAVHRRVRRVRDQLITEHGAATLIVVSHVTPIKALLRMALDAGPSLLHRLHLDIASLSVAEFYPDGPATVSLVNDTSHLT
jgi:probable phosphoglycerate mutase